MTRDDRTRLAPPADDQTRSLASGGDTVDRPDDGTPSDARVINDSADPSAAVLRATESLDAEPVSPSFEHYQLQGELGRGGMGVVYKALDTQFMRDVAIKVLSERLVGNPTAERRFVEEARVTGQLPHTAIPPVHQIGRLPDGRQFLVMKLIKGSTLGERLKARPHLTAGLADHLSALERVCQGVGYAHSRGVMHRDLKPANVMVGAFGEVQVMDWGLAREVRTAESRERVSGADFAVGDDPAPTADEPAPPDMLLRDVRPAGEEFTRAGTILGTPAYMSPEQATGDPEAMDARTDVFSLGAILCVILTGQPPYTGTTANEVVLKAINRETADAFRRLGHCTADPLVVDLCKRCLARDPAHRPANGEAVAKELAEIRATAAERLRRADLAEMARMTKLREATRRRRWQVALAAVVACLVALIGYAGWYVWNQDQSAKDAAKQKLIDDANARLAAEEAKTKAAAAVAQRVADEENKAKLKRAEREAAIEAALERAITALGEVRTTRTDDAWDSALERARVGYQLAEVRLKEDPTSQLAPRVKAVGERVSEATKQRQLASKLDDIASTFLEREQIADRNQAFADRYHATFHDAGYSELDPAGFARQVNEHPTPDTLIEAVFDWHSHALTGRRYPEDTATLRGALTPLLDRLVADRPFLAKWWAAQKDATPAGTRALLGLAAGREAGEQNAAVTHRMFVDLWDRGEREAAVRLMRDGLVRHPSDSRLHARFALHLGVLNTPAARTESLAHATAAVALRPKSANAYVLLGSLTAELSGDLDDALRYLDRAVELDRDRLPSRVDRAAVLVRLNRQKDAEDDYAVINKLDLNGGVRLKAVQARWAKGTKEEREAAAAELRAKVAPSLPKTLHAQLALARTCQVMTLHADAATAYRAAIAASPRWVHAQIEFGRYLIDRGRAGDREQFREAVTLLTKTAADFPADFVPQWNLAMACVELKEWEGSLKAARKAAELGKGVADAEWIVGFALWAAGQHDDATTATAAFAEQFPNDWRGPSLLAQIAAAQKKWGEAIKQSEHAAKLDKHNPSLWNDLGNYHAFNGDPTNAVKAYSEALRLDPNNALYHRSIAGQYALLRQPGKALEHMGKAGSAGRPR